MKSSHSYRYSWSRLGVTKNDSGAILLARIEKARR